jgi:lipopolysaccharide export system protein LptA
LTAAVFAAVAALTLWTGVNGQPSWAQSRRGSSGFVENRPATQYKLDGVQKSAQPAAGNRERSSTNKHQSKSAQSDSNNENNQMPFGAFANSNRGPISIQSDSLALDYKQNVVVFNGHVHVAQADAALTSNMLNVKYGKDFHEVQRMVAAGSVQISQGTRWCTSDRAVMDQGQHTVTLTGAPICHDARDQITGTRITVHLDTGKSDVEGAKAVIFPQPSKSRDNEAVAAQAK